ncbi:MAG: hypothetical protein ED557_10435 [Balneola sp.]|nr:MAG: hypothetical protein ED557_10435 [Balneola sp.]
MKTAEEQIVKRLRDFKRGKIFFPEMFYDLATNEAVRKALVRLENEGILVRLAHGIYLFPKVDEQLGVLYPPIDIIAKAVAKRDKAQIIPTGAYALNKLGLSTQVPLNAVYLTDGSQRSIKVGNRKIQFKRTVPKNLAVKGTISGLVIQALREIGKENTTGQQLIRIQDLLKKEDIQLLKHDAKLAPAWIRKIMLAEVENGG